MGGMLNKVCCIEDQTDYSVYPTRLSYPNDSSYPQSQFGYPLNQVPSSEIKIQSQTARNSQFVSSLSSFPIKVSTIIRKNAGNPSDNYISIKNMGKGAYGTVAKVMHKKTGAIRAMKIIAKDNLKPGFSDEEIQREINILKTLDHPGIIKIYEFYSDDDYYYLINEFCSEGDLSEKLIAAKYFDECIVKVLMFQIFSAVLYLHSKNIIHGDLKLENVMIDSVLPQTPISKRLSFIASMRKDLETIKHSHNNDSKLKFDQMKNFDLKLIDFGCSKIFTPYKRQFEDTIGTLVYCSPEVLKNNYDETCDVWSCGIIMYILLSGELPFYGTSEDKIVNNILSGKFNFESKRFNNVSEEAKDLIRQCLVYNKNKRIKIKEALDHPFFKTNLDRNNLFQAELDSKTVLNRLRKYSGHSKFYQAVLAFLSHNYADKAQIDKIKKIFLSIDLNFDGKISKEELLSAYKNNGIIVDQSQLNEIIKAIDSDNNGFIEYEEFIRAAIPKEKLFTEVNLKTAFDLFDLDKNGAISPSEVKEVLGMDSNVDEKVLDELLKEIKNTGNDEISFEQFKKIMTSFGEK